MEKRSKMRKRPNFPGLRRGISPIVPKTLEHPFYTFLMTNLLILSQKMVTKLKKNPVFLDQFHTVLSTKPFSHQKYGLSSLFYYTSLLDLVLTCIAQNFVFIAYAKQKLFGKNLFLGGGASARPPPWYPKG